MMNSALWSSPVFLKALSLVAVVVVVCVLRRPLVGVIERTRELTMGPFSVKMESGISMADPGSSTERSGNNRPQGSLQEACEVTPLNSEEQVREAGRTDEISGAAPVREGDQVHRRFGNVGTVSVSTTGLPSQGHGVTAPLKTSINEAVSRALAPMRAGLDKQMTDTLTR